MAVDLEKYRKQPTGAAPSAPIDINKYRKAAPVAGPTFSVPAAPIDHAARAKQFQAEADVSNAEAAKANSLWGMTKAFGKGLVKAIAPSEVGLGESVGKIMYANSPEFKTAQESTALGEDVKVNLLKTIREQEAQGKDTTRLKQAYNEQEKNVANTNSQLHALVQMPSTAKVAGQLGGTALDLFTAGTYGKAKTAGMGFGKLSMATPAVKTAATAVGVPELGAIAGQKAAGLFSLKGAGNVAKGAGLGYASDVALGLQGERGQEREGVKALIPGLGTALGASIPAVSEVAKTVDNIRHPEVRIAEKRMGALRDLETKNVKIATVFDAADRKGVDVRKTLAETNLLNGAISPDGRISSDKALANFNEFIQPYEGQVKQALKTEGRSVQINQLVNDAKDFINNSTLSDRQKVELQQELAGQLDAFSQFRGKAVPVTALHDTKVTLANSNNYLNPGKNIVDKEAARFFKDLVERNTSSMDVAKYNGELSKYYTVREALEKMDRAVVNGGRMGKYFSSLIGSGVGGMVGGPLGAIAGAEVGAKARGGMMTRAFGGDIKTGLTPTNDLLGALKPKATGKAAIPDVVMPKKAPIIPDVSLVPGKKAPMPPVSSLDVKPAITPVKKAPLAKILPWKYEPVPGVNPKLEAYRSGKPSREGGYIANPLAALASKQKDNQVGSLPNATIKPSGQQVETFKPGDTFALPNGKNGTFSGIVDTQKGKMVMYEDGSSFSQLEPIDSFNEIINKQENIVKTNNLNIATKEQDKIKQIQQSEADANLFGFDSQSSTHKNKIITDLNKGGFSKASFEKNAIAGTHKIVTYRDEKVPRLVDAKKWDSGEKTFAPTLNKTQESYFRFLTSNNQIKLQQRATTKGFDYNAIKASVDKRIAESTPDKKYTDDSAKSIADGINDAEFIEAPLKGADRTLEKVINETKTGDVSEIKDIARNTIMPTTKEAHAQVVAKMDARKDIYARKPQEGKDFMGYKGMIYNIKSPSGNITETQVVSPEMMFGKMLPEDSKRILGAEKFAEIQKRTGLKPGYGHEIYDKWRSMTRKEKASPAGQKLRKESEDYYAQLSSIGLDDILTSKMSLTNNDTPKTVRVWKKSKFSNGGGYADVPVIRKEENITLYQGGIGENRQFWTPDKKYASQFGEVQKKTGTFLKIDNGNRMTDVYIEFPSN